MADHAKFGLIAEMSVAPVKHIDVLIGAKKFMEGWNSWRVSNMGLLNIGRTEGSEIIQLFGRGVRLKGHDWSLKRSGHTLAPTRPQFIEDLETLNVFGIEDAQGGLAVLCPEGLHEHAVLDDAPRTLALTLLRTSRRTVGTDGEPGGQLIGTHEFSYALMAYAGGLDRGDVIRTTAELQAGVYRHFSAESPGERSLLRVSGGPVVVTSVKPAWDDGSVVVRLWNTGGEPAQAELHLDAPVQAAWLCNLNEEPREKLAAGEDGVCVEVPALGLATVRIAVA